MHFIVGDGSEEPTRAISKEKSSGIVRSYSQDTNMLLGAEDKSTSAFLSKTSYSENSLDSSAQDRPGHQRTPSGTSTTGLAAATTSSTATTTTTTTSSSHKKTLRELPTVMSVDDETLSTDSNSTTDNDELKRRRRKILFPPFRKNKTKVT